MIFNLLVLLTINVFIADANILTESLLNQLGINKNSSYINLNNPNITEIDTNAFKEYNNINSVYLWMNKLSTIDLKVFKSSSTKLTSILISAPSLTKLTNSEKTRFPILQSLELDINSLLSLDSDVLNGLPNLTFLALTNSFPLKPNQLSSLKKLEILKLKVKNQTSLSKAHLNGLTSLKILEFHSSNIQKIDNDTFTNLTNLESLHLRNNSLNQLDLSNSSGKLTSLTLSQNNLSYLRIPKKLDSLRSLDLTKNRFRSFRSIDFQAFPNLRNLYLSDNQQDNSSELSAYLKPLVNLTMAFFSNMSIKGTLDSNLFKFNKKLDIIDLSHNRIEKVASNAFVNLKITQIVLFNNLLTELDSSVFVGQNRLWSVVLDHNKLSKIGAKTFNDLPKLEGVSLVDNKLTKLDDLTFSGCSELVYVLLFNNTNLQTSNLQSLCPTEATRCSIHY